MMYFGIIPLILFIIFLISYLKDPRKIINGFYLMPLSVFPSFCVIVSLNSDSDVLRYIIFLPF